jgi:hypothetical protein
MVRLVIPIESFDIERSVIFPHFGRAPEFAVIDLSRHEVPNSNGGSGMHTVLRILNQHGGILLDSSLDENSRGCKAK